MKSALAQIFIRRILQRAILLWGFFYYSLPAHAQISPPIKTETFPYDEGQMLFYVNPKRVYINHIPDSVFNYFNKNFKKEVRIKKISNYGGGDDLYLIEIRTPCYNKAVEILDKLIRDRYASYLSDISDIGVVYECYSCIELEQAKKLTEERCK